MIVDYTIIVDGTSDAMLRHPVEWAILDIAPSARIRERRVHPRRHLPIGPTVERVRADARSALVFVHRDAESASWEDRAAEIPDDVVRIVPVRMTEAWFLTDERAIRQASGRPSSSRRLDVPPLRLLETLPDPKRVLDDLLLDAAGPPSGRRRKQYVRDLPRRRQLVAEYTTSFDALRTLGAFGRFLDDLAAALDHLAS